MKKIKTQHLYMLALLLFHPVHASKTKTTKKISSIRRSRKKRTNDFLRIAQKHNPTTTKGYKIFEFIVKNNLRTHLLRLYSQHKLEEKTEGKTALFIAVEQACKKAQNGENIFDYILIIQRLLDQGADVNTRDDELQQTPLHIAAYYKNEKIIKLLRSYGASNFLMDKNGKKAVDFAVDSTIIQDLIFATFPKKSLSTINIKHTQARLAQEVLMTLPHSDSIAKYKQIGHGASLFIAIECGMLYHLLALLGSSHNKSMINARISAKIRPYSKLSEKMTPLHLAVIQCCLYAKNGNLKKYNTYKGIIKVLLVNKADINAQTCQGNTPLHIAAKLNNPEIAALLLRYGANRYIENHKHKIPHKITRDGKTKDTIKCWDRKKRRLICKLKPLKHKLAQEFLQNIPRTLSLKKYKDHEDAEIHIAAVSGATEYLKCAMYNNELTTINATIAGETPLMAGIKQYVRFKNKNLKKEAAIRFNVIQFLLSQNAKVTISDNNGDTPLHIAVKNDDIKLVKILCKHNSGLLQKNNQGKSPIALAEELEDQTIFRELKKIIIPKKQSPQDPSAIQPKQKNHPLLVAPSAPPLITTHKHGYIYTRQIYPPIANTTQNDLVPLYPVTEYVELEDGTDQPLQSPPNFTNPFTEVTAPVQESAIALDATLNEMLPCVPSQLQPIYIPHSQKEETVGLLIDVQ